MNALSQRIRLCLFVMLLFVLAAARVLAREEARVYQYPGGRFSAAIPSGWTDESTAEYGLFTKDGVAIYLLAVEAGDMQSGIDAALQAVLPEVTGEPVQTAELPAPNGIWTQNVYALDGGALAVAFGQTKDGVTYVMAAHAPGQAAVQAATNDLNGTLLGFTIGEAVDLSGVARFDMLMFLVALPADQMIESLADIPMVAQPGEQLISGVRFEPLDPDSVADYLGTYEHGIEITMNGDQFTLVTVYGEIPLYPMGEDGSTFITGGSVAGFTMAFADAEGMMSLAVTAPTNPAAPYNLAKDG